MQYYCVLLKFFNSDKVHFLGFFALVFLLHSNCIHFYKLQDILQINTRSRLESQGEELQMPFFPPVISSWVTKMLWKYFKENKLCMLMGISLCLMNFFTFFVCPFCAVLLALLFQIVKIEKKKNWLLIQKTVLWVQVGRYLFCKQKMELGEPCKSREHIRTVGTIASNLKFMWFFEVICTIKNWWDFHTF